MTGTGVSPRKALWPVLILVVLPLVWGYNWVVMKRAMDYIGPFEFAAWRFLLGSLVLFGVLACLKRPLSIRPLGAVAWIGLFQYAGNMGLVLWALRGGPAGRSALLNYAMPLWVVLMAWPLLRERPSRPQVIALAAATAGIVLIFAAKGTQGRSGAAVRTHRQSGLQPGAPHHPPGRPGRGGGGRHLLAGLAPSAPLRRLARLADDLAAGDGSQPRHRCIAPAPPP